MILHGQLDLARVGEASFERVCDRTWWGHEALFGGYVQSLVLTAMATVLDRSDQPAQSMSMQFLRPFTEGTVRVDAAVERRGRTMANTSARAYSNGKLAGVAIATFGARRAVAEFAELSPPPELTPLAPGEKPSGDTFVPTHDYYEFYPRIGSFRRGSGAARVGGWMRQLHPGPVDCSLVFVLADDWMPAAYHRWDTPVPAVTADITTHFRTAFPRHDLAPEAPLFVELRTAGSLGGFVDEDVTIWSAAGELLAQSRQMRYVLA